MIKSGEEINYYVKHDLRVERIKFKIREKFLEVLQKLQEAKNLSTVTQRFFNTL